MKKNINSKISDFSEIENDGEEINENEIEVTIQNTYIIEGWKLRKAKEEDTKRLKDSRYYHLSCHEVNVFDYDKHNARPYIKDLLNRSNVFLEIKLLKIIIWICLVFTIFFVLLFVRLPSKAYLTETFTNSTPKTTTSTEWQNQMNVPTNGAMNIQDILLNK